MPHNRVAQTIEHLTSAGLVEYLRIGNRSYIILLRPGLEHPQYDVSAPRAAVADVERDFGLRLRILQVLQHLGTGCTNDIRAGLPSGSFGHSTVSAGSFMPGLKQSGWIQEIWPPLDRHQTFRLTQQGEYLLRKVTPFVSQSDPAALANAKERRDRRETQRAILRGQEVDSGLLDFREVKRMSVNDRGGDEDA